MLVFLLQAIIVPKRVYGVVWVRYHKNIQFDQTANNHAMAMTLQVYKKQTQLLCKETVKSSFYIENICLIDNLIFQIVFSLASKKASFEKDGNLFVIFLRY